MIGLASSPATALRLGTQTVSKMYLGSNQVWGGTVPETALPLVAMTDSTTSQTLMWGASTGSYELQRSVNSDYSGASTVYSGTSTYFTDTVTPGTNYYYRVRKTGSSLWGTHSRPVPYLYELFTGTTDAGLTGWTTVSGTFKYHVDQVQFTKGTTDAVAVKNINASDYVLQAYFHPKDRLASAPGLIFRYVDNNNYWMARWLQNSNTLEIQEKTSGTFTLRASATVTPYSTDEPYEIKVTCSGSTITAKIQHYNISATYTSTQHQAATSIGMRGTGTGDICGYVVAFPTDVPEVSFKPYGVLEYFQEPVATRFVGKFDRTYEGWVDRWGGTVVRWFDHKANKYGPLVIVDNLLSQDGIEAMDDHNPPALHILPDGKILCFYNVHNNNNRFYQKKTAIPEDLSSFGTRTSIVDAVTAVPYNYPQPITLSDGSLVLFYRRGVFSTSKWCYKRSINNGDTWGTSVILADNSPNGVYGYVAQNPDNKDEVHLTGYFARSEIQPVRQDIWYAKCANLRTGNVWTKTNGSTYTLPFNNDTADLVLESGNINCLATDIKVFNNKPYVCYGYDQNPNHKLRWATIENGAWVNREITPSRQFYDQNTYGTGGVHQYTPGHILNPDNPFQVILCADRSNTLEVELWDSADNGATWAKSSSITQNSPYDNFRPQWIPNAATDHRFIWCGGGKFTGFDGGRWWGYNNIRLQTLKSRVTEGKFAVPIEVLPVDLYANNYALTGSDINQWNTPSGNNFVSAAAATSKPQVDANGFAIFGVGDSLEASNVLFSSPVGQLSCFIRVKCNPATPAGNMLLVGSFRNDITNGRSFAIYAMASGVFTFYLSNNGTSATVVKNYTIPYTTAETVLGFTFNAGTLTIYKDGAVVTPTKVTDGSVPTIFNNGYKPVIGRNLMSTGALSSSWVDLDATVKKVQMKLGVMSATEIAAF